MTTGRFFAELIIVIAVAVILACATTPDGFHKLATHLSALVG